MTKQAEQVTVAFDDQIWAPANGIPVQAEGWTPLSFMAWFHQATRPTKGLAKLLRMQSGPISLSTALAYGFRYRAENGRLVPVGGAIASGRGAVVEGRPPGKHSVGAGIKRAFSPFRAPKAARPSRPHRASSVFGDSRPSSPLH